VGGQHHAPTALPPGNTRYPLYRRLGGPQGRSGRVRKISPPPGFDPRTFQPVVSRYTDWATRLTHSKYWCSIYLYMFRHFRMPSSGSQIWTCWDGASCRGKQISMGAVYCDRRRNDRDITGWRRPLYIARAMSQDRSRQRAVLTAVMKLGLHKMLVNSFSFSSKIGDEFIFSVKHQCSSFALLVCA
jgi:hypothetical protein